MIIKRGEIWLVQLDPTVGAEIQKIRPVIVVNSDAIGVLPIRLVAPIMEWKDIFSNSIWHIRVDPNDINGLIKTSSVDTLQLRGIDTSRFIKKVGSVSKTVMDMIVEAIKEVISD